MPRILLKVRWKCKGLRPAWRLRIARVSFSSRLASIYLQVFWISWALAEGLASCGWQRLQARKPDLSAASGWEKKATCAKFGRRAGHDGLQYISVERTAKTRSPSLVSSFSTTAFYFSTFFVMFPLCLSIGFSSYFLHGAARLCA